MMIFICIADAAICAETRLCYLHTPPLLLCLWSPGWPRGGDDGEGDRGARRDARGEQAVQYIKCAGIYMPEFCLSRTPSSAPATVD